MWIDLLCGRFTNLCGDSSKINVVDFLISVVVIVIYVVELQMCVTVTEIYELALLIYVVGIIIFRGV